MKMSHLTIVATSLLVASLADPAAWADVLNMGGTRNADGFWTGLASLEMVLVGDAGNAADTQVMNDGTSGYGGVNYEYRIGRYEVTAGQYCEFLSKVAATDNYGLYHAYMDYDANPGQYGCNIKRTGVSGGYSYTVAADWANRPVNFVSFGDACRFVNWLHNGQPNGEQGPGTTEDGAYALNGATSSAALLAVTRQAGCRWALPNEDEWYKAAYYDPGKVGGAGYWRYATGSNSNPGRDRTEATNPGNNANYWIEAYGHLIGSPYYRTPVGEFENSDSPWGTYDQMGNVWEWNAAVISDSYRGKRGGSFTSYNGNLPSSYRSKFNPTFEDAYFGFRVVQVPLTGDVDGDGHVDVVDLLYLVDAFGSMTGDANYDPRCDFNSDGAVDVTDLLDLVYNFGK